MKPEGLLLHLQVPPTSQILSWVWHAVQTPPPHFQIPDDSS